MLNPTCCKCEKKIFYAPTCPYCGKVQVSTRKKGLSLVDALKTRYRDQILEILTKDSSRLNWRRDALILLFRKVGLEVDFQMADLKREIEKEKNSV